MMAIKPASSRRFLHYSNQETTDAGATNRLALTCTSLCASLSAVAVGNTKQALKLPYLSLVLSATTDQQLGDKAVSHRKQSFSLYVQAPCVVQAVT